MARRQSSEISQPHRDSYWRAIGSTEEGARVFKDNLLTRFEKADVGQILLFWGVIATSLTKGREREREGGVENKGGENITPETPHTEIMNARSPGTGSAWSSLYLSRWAQSHRMLLLLLVSMLLLLLLLCRRFLESRQLLCAE